MDSHPSTPRGRRRSNQDENRTSLDAELVEQLVGELRCPLCNSVYGQDEIFVLQRVRQNIVLKVVCFCCGASSDVSISIEHVSLSSEMSPGEAFYFSQLPPLNEDTALRLQHKLKTHTGDLLDLIED